MSTINSKNVQVGTSGVATDNFTLYQPATPDGTVRLGVGNSGATTLDAVTVTSAGNLGIGTSSPTGGKLVITGSSVTTAQGIRLTGDTADARFICESATLGAGILGTFSNHSQLFYTNSTEQARITSAGVFHFNSGYGSAAVAYGCRAWVNFKGTGTVAIRGSGGVSSISDNGTGDFTVNFTTAFPDINYGASGLAEGGSAGDAAITIEKASILQTVSTMRVYVKQGATVTDRDYNFLSFFR